MQAHYIIISHSVMATTATKRLQQQHLLSTSPSCISYRVTYKQQQIARYDVVCGCTILLHHVARWQQQAKSINNEALCTSAPHVYITLLNGGITKHITCSHHVAPRQQQQCAHAQKLRIKHRHNNQLVTSNIDIIIVVINTMKTIKLKLWYLVCKGTRH